MKRISLILLLCLTLVAATGAAAQDTAISASGSVDALRTVSLLFGMPGTVSEVSVEVGQVVHQGDVLARLDTSDLDLAVRSAETQLQAQQVRYDQLIAPPRDVDVAAAQAALAAAQASANAAYGAAPSNEQVQIAQLQIELAQNQLWQAQLQRDRTQSVAPEFRQRSGGAPSVEDAQITAGLEQANTGIEIAQTRYQNVASEGPDLSRLGSATASIVQAQVALDQLVGGPTEFAREQAELALQISQQAVAAARLQLEQAVIIAPFDGIVTANNLVVGQLPPTAQPAITLADTSRFTVELRIGEADIVHVILDQLTQVTLDALPGVSLTGIVTRIDLIPLKDEAVPTYGTQVTLTQIDPRLKAGMSATAAIEGAN